MMKTIFSKQALTFPKVFTVVFLLLAAGVVTSLLWQPKVYVSTARVEIMKSDAATPQHDMYFLMTEFQRMTSPAVLNRVVEELALTNWLARHTGRAGPLLPNESSEMLKRMVTFRTIPLTRMVEIKVINEDGVAAALIANRIVDVYREQSNGRNPHASVAVLDPATPGLRPLRPNLPRHLSLGLSGSVVLAAVMGLLLRRFISTNTKAV